MSDLRPDRGNIPSLTEGNVESNFRLPGVDRVAVSFELADFESDPACWEHYSTSRQEGDVVLETFGSRVEVVPGVKAFVGVQRRPERSSAHEPVRGKVELNPARVVDPGGYGLASGGEAVEACLAGLVAASGLVRVRDWSDLDAFRVTRLDVARDFRGVTSVSSLIRGLAPIRRAWARRNLVHADPSRNGAQTLYVGSGAGGTRLYDKHVETGGAVERGTIRWEAECRSDWAAKYGGMAYLSQVSQEGVVELAADRWRWSAMGVEVKSTAGVVEVVGRSDLTPREQSMFVGWLVMQSCGGGAWEPSEPTLRKFGRLQRDLNVAIGPDVVSSVGFSSRLDWDLGREVVSVAA